MNKNISDPTKYYDKTSSETLVQQKISGVVREYIRIFADEYELFKIGQKERIGRIESENKFATLKGADAVERHLAEWPATMETALRMQLSKEEYQWLRTHEGMFWILTKFPEFRITHKV